MSALHDRTADGGLRELLLRYCRPRTAPGDSAEDLVQEVLMSLLEQGRLPASVPSEAEAEAGTNQSSGAPEPTLVAYALGIARNKAADGWRSAPPRANLEDVALWPDPAPGPEEAVVHRDELRRLTRLLGRIPPSQARLLSLRVSGVGLTEAAALVGLTPAAASSAQARALRRLRELAEAGEDAAALAWRPPRPATLAAAPRPRRGSDAGA